MAHIGARAFAAFDDRHINIYMGPSAQKHTIDEFNADNFDHGGLASRSSFALGSPARKMKQH